MASWFDNLIERLHTPLQSSKSKNQTDFKLISLIGGPFAFVIDNFKQWFVFSGIYAFIISLLSFISGYSYACTTGDLLGVLNCSNSSFIYIIYIVFKFGFWGIYLNKWCEYCNNNFANTQPLFSFLNKQSLKALLLWFAFVFSFAIPLMSLYLLIIRTPNPNWKIEVAYFGVVSIGFWIPFIIARFYSLFGFVATGNTLPKLTYIWDKTKGQMFKIILAIFVMLMIFAFIYSNFVMQFRYIGNSNLLVYGLISEFLHNFIQLTLISLFAGQCVVQKNMIVGDTNEQ